MRSERKFTAPCILKVVCRIPCSCITTYGAISSCLTRDKDSAVAVGACIKSIRRHYELKEVPVHRVVKADGEIPLKENADALKKEGVPVECRNDKWRVTDFKKYFWQP